MILGAEPKKVAILAGLLVTAAAIYFWPSSDDAPPDARAASKNAPNRPSGVPATASAASRPGVTAPNISRAGSQTRTNQEFRPRFGPGKNGERLAPETIDPTLRLDLLAKVQQTQLSGGQRSLFDFGALPAAATPKVPTIRVAGDGIREPNISPTPFGPQPAPPPPPPPPPPPITLKFYGFVNTSSASGRKRAFFLDGEDIYVAAEGDMVKKQYKIIRIGVSSAVVEDVTHKNQQTLPLEEQQG